MNLSYEFAIRDGESIRPLPTPPPPHQLCYTISSALHHHHLLATTSPFAPTSNVPQHHHLLHGIAFPLVSPSGIAMLKLRKAIEILVMALVREGEGVGMVVTANLAIEVHGLTD